MSQLARQQNSFGLACVVYGLWVLAGLVALAAPPASAAPWPNFQAQFNVKVYGIHIGQVHQAWSCQAQQCTLTTQAAPPQWAQAWINEKTHERSTLHIQNQTLVWQGHTQTLTRTHDDGRTQQTHRLVRQPEKDRVLYLEKNRAFDLKPALFDQNALAYALAYLAQKHPQNPDFRWPTFWLQSKDKQRALALIQKGVPKRLDLPFEAAAQTLYYKLQGDGIQIELWLHPKRRYFPVKIIIQSDTNDRTVHLQLNKAPDYETQ